MVKNLLFAATAFVALSMSANAQETISFEASEGYSLGDINGQQGWVVTGDGAGGFISNQEVSNTMATDGTYSLKIANDPAFGGQDNGPIMGGFYDFASSVPHQTISFDVYIDDVIGEGADYRFSTANLEEGLFISTVYFSWDGVLVLQGEEFIEIENGWTPNTWYHVEIEVVDGEIVYKMNDDIVYQGTASAGQLGNIDHLRFIHDNYSADGVAYIDNIKINDTDTSTENFDKLGLSVFPNPVSDIVNITSPEANIEMVTITDLNGRTVKSINFNNVAETTIDASDLASGIYLMNITANGTVATQKIVKK